MTVRIALIGLGDMGAGHLRGFLALESCEVVAISDNDSNWNGLRRIDPGPTPPLFFAEYREMLSSVKPDAVVVSVPDFLHRQVATDCLRAGCHLLLEKPVATTLADCDAIIAEAKRAERILQIGLVYRYSRLYRKMAALSHEGPIGPVRLMWCKELRHCFPPKDWFFEQEKCGGTIVEKDCHHFDIFNWVMGGRPVRVSAFGGQHVYRNGQPIRIECSYTPGEVLVKDNIDTVDHAVINVQYDNGGVASLVLCMYLKPENVMPEGLEIGAIGLNGTQMCAYHDNRIGIGGGERPWTWLDYNAEADHMNLGHIGCQQERIEFIECIVRKRRPFADGKVGRDSLVVALAAEESIRTGRPVDIQE